MLHGPCGVAANVCGDAHGHCVENDYYAVCSGAQHAHAYINTDRERPLKDKGRKNLLQLLDNALHPTMTQKKRCVKLASL